MIFYICIYRYSWIRGNKNEDKRFYVKVVAKMSENGAKKNNNKESMKSKETKQDIIKAHKVYAEEIIKMYHGEEFIKQAEERYPYIKRQHRRMEPGRKQRPCRRYFI